MSQGWFVDRTRYMTGFACPWRRLLGYHAFGTGITAETEALPLATGRAIHSCLEALIKPLIGKPNPELPAMETTALYIEQPLGAFKLWLAEEFSANRLSSEEAGFQLDTVESLVHAYSMLALPWVVDKQEILSVEQELLLKLGEALMWMARPDLITRSEGKLYIHDFKSSAWQIKQEDWSDSLQMMLNCFAAQATWGIPVGGYYVHGLRKGTPTHPSPLTHPYYQPSNPPFQVERIALRYDEAKATKMQRVRIRTQMDLPRFIWDLNIKGHRDTLAEYVKVLGPFQYSQYKVNQFLTGLPGNENGWIEKLNTVDWSQWANPSFQGMLDALFPRTYECQTFNRQCDYYSLCFKHDGWQKVFTNFKHRVSHHTTEPAAIPIWPKGDEPK